MDTNTSSLSKDFISAQLEETATYMRLAGENDFKAIAFDRAARTIENLEEDVNLIIQEKRLTDIKGIGKSIAQDIYKLAELGEIPVLSKLKEQVPESLAKWLNISGLGPKKIYKIHHELGITTIDELRAACEDGSVAGLKGMGKKSAEKILKSIDWMEQFAERCRLDEALELAGRMSAELEQVPGIQRFSTAGSLRRRLETIGDIDFLVAAKQEDAAAIFDAFTSHPDVTEALGRGDTKSSVRTSEGRQVDLRIVSEEEFPAALMYFTGSKEHNVVMRQRARARGLTLNEYGLFKMDDEGNTDFDQPVKTSSESDIYKALDLNFIPPELREDRGEFHWFEKQDAAALSLPEETHIRGILHAHSTWSDGKRTIEEMAEACMERGYEYLGLTDHSKTAAYAGGLTIERVKQQWEEVDALNAGYKEKGINFRIFKGIESDILQDGSLDYPDEILEGFDFVIASVHASLDMPPEKMLARYTKAIENPHTRIVGHPTARILLQRNGSNVDIEKLVELAAEHNTAIEINANPRRLDIDWRHGQKARREGLMTAICPDAHTIEGLDDVPYGIAIARKGWYSTGRILNTKSAEELEEWFGER
jgi:DNA polymerase (family 10)